MDDSTHYEAPQWPDAQWQRDFAGPLISLNCPDHFIRVTPCWLFRRSNFPDEHMIQRSVRSLCSLEGDRRAAACRRQDNRVLGLEANQLVRELSTGVDAISEHDLVPFQCGFSG